MTIIRPNSISGITSITAQSDTINLYKSDGTLSGLQLNGVNFNTTSGISTFSNVVVSDGSASTPSLKFSSSSTSGLYSPGANQFGIATNGTARIIIDSNGNVTIANTINVPLGSASSPSIYFAGDSNTGIYSPGADQLAISTNGTERMRLDSSGRLGLGTSSPSSQLDVRGSAVDFDAVRLLNTNASSSDATSSALRLGITNSLGQRYARIQATEQDANNNSVNLDFYTNSSASPTGETIKMRIDGSGNVGIGTTSPATSLHLLGANTAARGQLSVAGNSADPRITLYRDGSFIGSLNADTTNGVAVTAESGYSITFNPGGTSEKARFDTSGRLLVGTSSARSSLYNGAAVTPSFQLESGGESGSIALITNTSAGAQPPALAFGKTRSSSFASVSSGDGIGRLTFQAADGTDLVEGARIEAVVDGTPGSNDMPGRLVFSTTADGASSPTERMRITSAGNLLVGATTSSGFRAEITQSNATPLLIARLGNDGGLIDFVQDTTIEGSISVSGTTVTYGGGHLARWSQLPNEEDPSTLLKGTVMSNLDEMCEWGEEDNEQLNKTKVSDVEGDPNVAGVFVSTSFSDDGPLDFFVAMTGDMIIRIAEGVTVQRGDLLMSAGDGTAKPQDDDIIRSKTVAKVTSTHVTCTYDDGSYCVPCVLMAC